MWELSLLANNLAILKSRVSHPGNQRGRSLEGRSITERLGQHPFEIQHDHHSACRPLLSPSVG